jgi:hypothetical protein
MLTFLEISASEPIKKGLDFTLITFRYLKVMRELSFWTSFFKLDRAYFKENQIY